VRRKAAVGEVEGPQRRAGHERVEGSPRLGHALGRARQHDAAHRRLLAIGQPQQRSPAPDLDVVGVGAEAEDLEGAGG
jgi:hypothetical protein